jgi:hypothetical protein
VRLTAMPRLAAVDAAAELRLDLDAPDLPDPGNIAARLRDVELLLRPLPTAYAGAQVCGDAGAAGAHARAASDANPYLAAAALLVAAFEPRAGGSGGDGTDFRSAIRRLHGAEWAGEWLAPLFVHDALAIAKREADMRDAAVSEWDRDRYWECG